MEKGNLIRSDKDYWATPIDTKVLTDNELSQTSRFIFAILCTFANFQNRNCWPSIKTVAELSGYSERTVNRAYNELEQRGVIKRTARFNENGRTSSDYFIVGHNAECYAEAEAENDTHVATPTTPMSQELNQDNNINNYSKEAEPEKFIPEDVPEAMKSVSSYMLYRTGRGFLTESEVSALRAIALIHVPMRVQKEIDRACERFERQKKNLRNLRFEYIEAALKSQPSTLKQVTSKKAKNHDDIPVEQNYDVAELDRQLEEAMSQL